MDTRKETKKDPKKGRRMHTQDEIFKILRGPNKDRIANAWTYAFDESASIHLDFVIALREISENHFVPMPTDEICVTNIGYEDDHGYSIILEGKCYASFIEPTEETYQHAEMYPCKFRACYNVATRRGMIKFKLDK